MKTETLREQLLRLVNEGKIVRLLRIGSDNQGFIIKCVKGHQLAKFMEIEDVLIGDIEINL